VAVDTSRLTKKMLGDAGEHYALSQLALAGNPTTKMPEGWRDYDLAVETGKGLVRVSVKTRSESPGWRTSRWFNFDDRKKCDWFVFLFQQKSGQLRSWVIPFSVAAQCGNKPGPNRKKPHERDLAWCRLNKAPLAQYENNWSLNTFPADSVNQRA
jgi:Holliday junction resolvase-like predicted endonuclease